MMKFERHKVEPPLWLLKNCVKWGQQATRVRDNGKEVCWYKYKKKPVNQYLSPLLREISKNHCAFCDGYPMQQMVEEIEHFKPKSRFPELSHQWENLFPICSKCNGHKSNDFSELLLRPDDNNYSFEKYFKMNFEGVLEPEIGITDLEKEQVNKTIELYGLNEYNRPELRIEELQKKQSNQSGLYRFLYF